MADEKDAEKQEGSGQDRTDEKNAEKSGKKSVLALFLPWIIIAVVAVLCAAAGFGAGRLFAGSRAQQTTETPQHDRTTAPEDPYPQGSPAESQEVWYYPLEPVVANLDVPGVTRYVRATLILGMDAQADRKQTTTFLEEKTPLLINWLTIFLASLHLEDIRGDRNLIRIQSQIADSFNEKLFPDAKPRIKKILFKEFAVQ